MGKYKLICNDYRYIEEALFKFIEGRKAGTKLASIIEFSAVSMVPLAALLVFYLEKNQDVTAEETLKTVVSFYDYQLEVS